MSTLEVLEKLPATLILKRTKIGENDLHTYTTSAVGASLENVLERVYNWLKEKGYVI